MKERSVDAPLLCLFSCFWGPTLPLVCCPTLLPAWVLSVFLPLSHPGSDPPSVLESLPLVVSSSSCSTIVLPSLSPSGIASHPVFTLVPTLPPAGADTVPAAIRSPVSENEYVPSTLPSEYCDDCELYENWERLRRSLSSRLSLGLVTRSLEPSSTKTLSSTVTCLLLTSAEARVSGTGRSRDMTRAETLSQRRWAEQTLRECRSSLFCSWCGEKANASTECHETRRRSGAQPNVATSAAVGRFGNTRRLTLTSNTQVRV